MMSDALPTNINLPASQQQRISWRKREPEYATKRIVHNDVLANGWTYEYEYSIYSECVLCVYV